MKKEAFIKLAKDQIVAVEIQELAVSNAFFALSALEVNVNEPLYLEIKHEQLNTSIDLTGLIYSVILHLDDNGLIRSVTYVVPNSSGSYAIITQNKKLILLPYPISFSIDEVKRVFFFEYAK